MTRPAKPEAPPVAHPCQIYLVVPAPQVPRLGAVLDAAPVAALRGPAEAGPLAQSRGIAFILDGGAAAALAAQADGAHLPPGSDIAAARRAARDLQLGLSCGASRDAAMEAGDEGIDYVAFDAAEGAEAIAWWAQLMELPVVAENITSLAQATALAAAGADFVALDDVIWSAPEGPEAALRAYADALQAAPPPA